jgi:proteic killer suppression protein
MAGRRISGYGVELGACPVHEGLRRLHGSLGILRTEHIHRCRITESIGVADPPRFQAFERVAQRKIRQLEIAGQLDDLRVPPVNCLEALRGDRMGQHSIRINDQFRRCFRWSDSEPEAVAIVDYH